MSFSQELGLRCHECNDLVFPPRETPCEREFNLPTALRCSSSQASGMAHRKFTLPSNMDAGSDGGSKAARFDLTEATEGATTGARRVESPPLLTLAPDLFFFFVFRDAHNAYANVGGGVTPWN